VSCLGEGAKTAELLDVGGFVGLRGHVTSVLKLGKNLGDGEWPWRMEKGFWKLLPGDVSKSEVGIGKRLLVAISPSKGKPSTEDENGGGRYGGQGGE